MPWINPTDKPKITVGIDPDVNKSGVVIRYDLQGKTFEAKLLTFFALYDKLRILRDKYGRDSLTVRIEAAWLIAKSNFHGREGQSKGAGERIAKNVGSNHETGRKIVEMCDFLRIAYELVKPTSSKWTPQYLKAATGIETKNQEIIDAGRLVA